MNELTSRARAATLALWVCVAACALAFIAHIAALPMLDDITDIDALNSFDAVTGLAWMVMLLAMIAGAVFFIRWFNLIHRGLDSLSPGVRRHATWWSIGGWFIPIMGLFRPKQILDDMLACANGRDSAAPWWAGTWWGLWIAGSLIVNLSSRLSSGADTVDALRGATIADAVGIALFVGAGIVAVTVVKEVTEAIQRKYGEVHAAPAMAPRESEPPPPLAAEPGWS